MSFLDRIASAVLPAASDEDRAQARRNAQSLAQGNDWFAQILLHHRGIEDAFNQAFSATQASDKLSAVKTLGVLLTGHSNAEEAVIYPAVVEHSSKSHATMAYEEQAMAKIQLAMLEELDPLGAEWREKLEHLQSAVAQHVYQEESSWFPEVLRNAPPAKQKLLTERYAEEYDRYHVQAGGLGPIGSQALNQPSAAHIG
jgi:hemerythrin superfamily protein